MEQDKKQKVLIAILAVAGLGAGSFYWFNRETDNTQVVATEGSTGRKERKKSDSTAKEEGRKERVAKAPAAAEPAGRKERTERPVAESGRKARGKANTEIKKKSKIVPAA